jgi:serine/threonine protein kinase
MQEPSDSRAEWTDPAWHRSDRSRPAEDRIGELAGVFLDRHRRGERPSVEDDATAHPELAGEIRRLFPALLLMEELKPAPVDDAFENCPSHLGDYRILREVGRGGMGVVYEAEQESLGRRVALKVLGAQGLRDPAQLLRFRREARAAANLHHTNIVPVFGVGEFEGMHYYVMQFIPGLGLDAVLRELRRLRDPAPGPDADSCCVIRRGRARAAVMARSLMTGLFPLAPCHARPHRQPGDAPDGTADARPADASSPVVLPGQSEPSSATDSARHYARSVAMIGVQVAEALEYAHRQGTLHRDIKPSNLLLDAQGTVWVADFGLAKASDSDDLTHPGDIVGTVRYMAPERFEGHCDARSDVYALGLTLYELLARRPAFDKADRAELVRQVTGAEPPRLRDLDPTIPRDLETVVHKAIEREPSRRFADAAALADDLRRFLDGRPVRARRIGQTEYAWRWCRRNPTASALVATTFALVALAAAWWTESWHRYGRARQAVESALEQVAAWRQEGRWDEAKAVLLQADSRLNDAGLLRLRTLFRHSFYDLNLAAKLEDIRLRRTGLLEDPSHHRSTAREYSAVFQEARSKFATDRAAAERIRMSPIREMLLAGLDDWALVEEDEVMRSRLLQVARWADPDPSWRDRVRDPDVRHDRAALERLAAEAPTADAPPQLLTTLGVLLRQAGGDAEPLLRAAQRRRPTDFWLNYELGRMLAEAKPWDAIGFYRAALALRPRTGSIYCNLGLAQASAGDWEEARESYRQAISIDPEPAAAQTRLGDLLAAHPGRAPATGPNGAARPPSR